RAVLQRELTPPTSPGGDASDLPVATAEGARHVEGRIGEAVHLRAVFGVEPELTVGVPIAVGADVAGWSLIGRAGPLEPALAQWHAWPLLDRRTVCRRSVRR